MARIAGVDLPRTKRVEIGLTYIYGIGRVRSNGILKDAGVSPDIRVKDLSEDDVRKISRVIEEQGGVEGDLRKEVSMNIKRLMEIGCYRGLRHRRALPAAMAAWVAAKGVPLRDPLKPIPPALDHATTDPAGSVMVMMVLLKEA